MPRTGKHEGQSMNGKGTDMEEPHGNAPKQTDNLIIFHVFQTIGCLEFQKFPNANLGVLRIPGSIPWLSGRDRCIDFTVGF